MPAEPQVFDEKRYFTAGDSPCVVTLGDWQVGITICEDIGTGARRSGEGSGRSGSD